MVRSNHRATVTLYYTLFSNQKRFDLSHPPALRRRSRLPDRPCIWAAICHNWALSFLTRATNAETCVPFAVVVAVLLPSLAVACLWDYDTLKMERSRFPSTLELITGKFLRHSKEFYEWRVRDRLAKLKEYPDQLAWYDDLAVAYDKLGQHQKAIDLMLEKERKQPRPV